MIKLQKPSFQVGAVYNDCVDSVDDDSLKLLLQSCSKEINDDEMLYEDLATKTLLYTFPKKTTVNNCIDITEMKKIYTYRMVAGVGRPYYDEIFRLSKRGICPSCGERDVDTLDHYLPKTKYPTLVVTPINLVPSCSKCNKKKLASTAGSIYNEPIHPYYDDIQTERWLFSEILKRNNGLTIKFFFVAPNNWDQILSKRVENHFVTLELNKLYSIRAGVELSDKKYRLCKLHTEIGTSAVKKYLLELVEDFSSHINYWKKSMFECLASSDWFCDKGIYLID